jgi:endonuclease G
MREIFLAAIAWFALFAVSQAQDSISIHLTMGNPSRAVANKALRENYLVLHDECAMSFNATIGISNWVSWRLAADDIGNADRADLDFVRDVMLPEEFPKTPVQLYRNSGFDKGHVMPAADRSRRAKGMRGTFLLTNCMPQAPKLNRGPWNRHEAHRRELAAGGKELFIIAGPAGWGGLGEKGFRRSLGRDVPDWTGKKPLSPGFDVPGWCWGACLILDDRDGDDLARVTAKTPALAVIMPNTQEIDGPWEKYQVPVRWVEDLTGLNLFDLVDEEVQDAIEAAPVVSAR